MVRTILKAGRRHAAAMGLAFACARDSWRLRRSAQTPTSAQIEAFQSLPPEQQQQSDAASSASRRGAHRRRSAARRRPATTHGAGRGRPFPSPCRCRRTPHDRGRSRGCEAGDTLLLDVAESVGLTLDAARARRARAHGQPTAEQATGDRGLRSNSSAASAPAIRTASTAAAASSCRTRSRIPLAGLTAEEAQERLNADPAHAIDDVPREVSCPSSRSSSRSATTSSRRMVRRPSRRRPTSRCRPTTSSARVTRFSSS